MKPSCLLLTQLLMVCSILFAGCWNRVEINDLALVTAAAIDKKTEHTIQLHLQIFIPKVLGTTQQGGSGGGQQLPPTIVRSGEGRTIAEAMSKVQEVLPRKIFWGHNSVLLIGEALAKDGIREQIDFLARDPMPRQRMYIYVSKGQAQDLLQLLPPIERHSGEVLRELSNLHTGLVVTLKDLMGMLSDESGDCVLPLIEELPPRPPLTKYQTIAYICGTAVFKRDKMVGSLNNNVSKGLLWLLNQIDLENVTLKPKGTDRSLTVRILHGHTDLTPNITGDNWTMNITVEAKGELAQYTGQENAMEPAVLSRLEQQLSQQLEKHLRTTIAYLQAKQTDVIQFAERFHQQYPTQWNQVKDRWPEMFARIHTNIRVKSQLLRTGLVTQPSGIPSKE